MDVGQIPAELIQAGCKMYSEVQKLINSIWNKEEIQAIILTAVITREYHCYQPFFSQG
jgi:hypothetical protein